MQPSKMVIAGFSVAIDCQNDSLNSHMATELKPFFGGDGGDLKLGLSLDWAEFSSAPRAEKGQIEVTLPSGLEVRLNQESDPGRIQLDVIADSSQPEAGRDDRYLFDFIINYIFSLVIQQLQAEGRAHIFLVHSCGVIDGGSGYLFAGVSGKGKSTVANQLALCGKQLLGDDMVLVSHDAGGWQVHGSPMGGDISRATLSNSSVPLAAIFLIDQEKETSWRSASKAEATAALIGLVVPSYPLTRVAPKKLADYNGETVEILLEEAALLAADIPCYRLGLSLDDQPWDRLFSDIEKERQEHSGKYR